MRINPIVYGIIVVAVFLGIVNGFQTAGVWSVSGKVTSDGQQVQPLAADVETIKGWMTLDQISSVYQVPLAELLNHFGLPADTPAATAIKDLESDTFDTTLLKDWLTSRTGTVESTPLDSPEQSTPIAASPVDAAAIPSETPVLDKTITGKTTFQQLLDWGLTTEVIEEIIGGELPAPTTLVKDYVVAQGLEFSTAKTRLQAELDKLK